MNKTTATKTTPIVPAKLIRPITKRILPRERLFHSIDSGREKKVIWISGPAGSGKTTLAASYLDSQKGPCLWYQLDGGDADLATFFYYMGLAAKNTVPRNRTSLPLLTPEYLLGIPIFAKRFFEQLASKLIGKRKLSTSSKNGQPVIVLDNYQDIPEDSLLHSVINAGIFSLPQGVSVIILSRNESHPAYARMRAAGEISLMSWEDIRLTAEESNEIVRLRTGSDIPGNKLSLLYNTIDGWVAGLILLMESQGTKDFNSIFCSRLQRDEIFEYFTSEMFDRSSLENQDFLIKTSFLTKMNAHMAEKITGNTKARYIFIEFNRKNYFTNKYFFHELEFQYHPLFQEFLQAKAEMNFSMEQLRDIRNRAAKILEENGFGEDAVSLFCKAGNWAEAAQMILTHAPGLISQGRWQTLQSWIQLLPEIERGKNPWLVFWIGVCLVHSAPAESKKVFARSFRKFKKMNDVMGSFFALSGMFDTVAYRFDSFTEYDELILMMNTLLEEHPQYPLPEIEARVTTSMLYAYTLRQPQSPALGQWEKCARDVLKEITNPEIAGHILCGLIFYLLFTGEITKAKPDLDSLNKMIDTNHAPPLAVQTLRNLQAFYYWTTADFEKNQWAAEDGIAQADFTGVHFIDCFLLGHGAAGALSIEEIARAKGYLDRMLATIHKMPSAAAECLYHILKAWQYLLEDNLVQASVHADLGLKKNTAMGAPLMMPYPHLIKAIVMHRFEDDGKAYAHLSEFWKIANTIPVFQVKFMAFLFESQIAFDNVKEVKGIASLAKAMTIGRKYNYLNGLFWERKTMSMLCVKALEAGIEVEYVHNLIRGRNLVPDVSVLHVEDWPWEFRIITLGQFKIVRDGDVVLSSGKVRQKPLLLLKVLIALGGSNVNAEYLCDILWPDADGDLAYRSFETTLYRLRQLIGKNTIHLSEGRLTLKTESCWVDAFALEQKLNQAEGFWEACRQDGKEPLFSQEKTEQAISLTQQAVSLYQGHFLETEREQSWLISQQERLRSKFIRGIVSMATYFETAGKLEMAIKCYHKALEVDDLAEEIYQSLMTIYYRLGQRSKVLAVYKRCKAVFEAKLNIEPSPRTDALLLTSRGGGR